MTDNFTIFYIVFGTIGLVLSFFLIRWVLGVDRHLKNQKAIIALLSKLCIKQGVPADEIDGIKNTFDIK
jgi:hypothetical protein